MGHIIVAFEVTGKGVYCERCALDAYRNGASMARISSRFVKRLLCANCGRSLKQPQAVPPKYPATYRLKGR